MSTAERRWGLRLFGMLLGLSLAAEAAVAQGMPAGVSRFFRSFFGYLQNQFIVFFFTFIFMFMLFYSIFAAVAGRLAVFRGEGGLSRPGKIFSVAMAMLACFAIFYFTKGRSIKQILEDVLGPFGVFAGLLLALIAFLLVYRGFRDELGWGWAATLALFIAGLGLVALGGILTAPNIMAWGYFIAFVSLLVGGLIMLIRGGARPAGREDHDRGLRPGETEEEWRRRREEEERRRGRPSRVRNIQWCSESPTRIRIWWEPNPASDNVRRYHIRQLRGRWIGRFFPRTWHADTPLFVQDGFTAGREYQFAISADNGRWSRAEIVTVRMGDSRCGAPPPAGPEPRIAVDPIVGDDYYGAGITVNP